MKHNLFRAGAVALLCICGTALADKIIIKEAAIPIERQGDVYVPQGDVVLTGDRYIFTEGDTKRVCFRTVQPTYSKINLGTYAIRVKDKVDNFYCYSFDPEYFSTSY